MSPAALVPAILGLALAQEPTLTTPTDADADATWVTPASQSALDGPFGIEFVPRYADVGDAYARRDHDLQVLSDALPAMSPSARRRAARQADTRRVAVRHWIDVFAARTTATDVAPDARSRLLRQLDLLRMEESTLTAQLDLLGGSEPAAARAPTPPTPPVPPAPPVPPRPPHGKVRDAVAFGDDLVVDEGQVVRDAVAFGGDVVVRGTVQRHASAFGGDVHVTRTGSVGGELEAFGGTVVVDGQAADPTPDGIVARHDDTDALGDSLADEVGAHAMAAPGLLAVLFGWLVPFLAFSGAGVLTVGMVPERVGRVADMVEDRPVVSLVLGLVGVLAILLGAVVFTLTVIGIPITLLLLGTLGLAWLLGFVGLCQAIGDRLPFADVALGRWAAFLVGALLVSLIGALPAVGVLVVVVASTMGIGASLATRLGRA
ncbi:MAG: hypothetical protein H6733_05585 [Alphaproteobacteria bacterium]|nr:hypothetical protein [Alphaproteobacteria bacterium]